MVRHEEHGRTVRPFRGRVPRSRHGRRRVRVQGRAWPLSPLCQLCVSVGPPNADLPHPQGPRKPDLRLGGQPADARRRMDLRTGERRHTRPRQQRGDSPPGLHRRPTRLHRSRDRADPVGPRILDHRQQRIVGDHPDVRPRVRQRRRSRSDLLPAASRGRHRRRQRLCLQPDQQRGLQSRVRDDAVGLRGSGRALSSTPWTPSKTASG